MYSEIVWASIKPNTVFDIKNLFLCGYDVQQFEKKAAQRSEEWLYQTNYFGYTHHNHLNFLNYCEQYIFV
jgi:hypothetical protein